jgi:hypothetical protein
MSVIIGGSTGKYAGAVDQSRLVNQHGIYMQRDRIIVLDQVSNVGDLLYNACQDSNCPRYGAAHPVIPHLVVDEFWAEPTGGNTGVRLKVIYRYKPAIAEIRVGSAVVSTPTHEYLNSSGVWTSIALTVPTSQVGLPNPENDNKPYASDDKKGAVVQYQKTVTTMSCVQIETGSPGDKSKAYVGCVNSGTVPFDSGAPTGSWLCIGIDGVSVDGGINYTVTYSFAFDDVDLWQQKCYWICPQTGSPAKDSTLVYVQTQYGADFTAMGLRFT